jgi:Flp pilus assembly protein TadG
MGAWTMVARNFISGLLRDRSGNALILASVALPALIGAGGLAMDTIQWTLMQRQLQREADSAALAGAFAKAQGASASTAATASIGRDNLVTLSATPIIESAPTKGAYAGNTGAVRVVLETTNTLPFSNTFLGKATRMTVEATAASLTNGNYCIISLETSSSAGITMQGSSIVNMGCGLATNSKASPAVIAGGSTQVTASHVAAVGGLKNSANYIGGTVLLPYSVPQKDPFAALPTPSVPTPCNSQMKIQPGDTRTTKSAGCYKGISINGPVYLNPGIYIVDGSISFGAQGDAQMAPGSTGGLTFILTSGTPNNANSFGSLSMNGGATINLTATTTGTYKGVLFYQDRRAPAGGSNTVNGNSGSVLQGAFYFKSQDLSFSGDSGITTDCVQLVSRRVTFTGNTDILNECPVDSGAGSFIGTRVFLVA